MLAFLARGSASPLVHIAAVTELTVVIYLLHYLAFVLRCHAEMVVPYGDPREPHFRKNAFDAGEDGVRGLLGICSRQLPLLVLGSGVCPGRLIS